MLPKQHRLAKTTEIAAVQSRGRRFFNQFFTITVSGKNSTSARFAFVVSTKVSKKAVARNRLRRALRSVVAPLLPKIKPGDYIVTAKSSAVKLTNAEIATTLNEFLKKLKLLS